MASTVSSTNLPPIGADGHDLVQNRDSVALWGPLVEPFLKGSLAISGDIPPALEQARAVAGPDDLICVAGSLFVAAAAREALDLDGVID